MSLLSSRDRFWRGIQRAAASRATAYALAILAIISGAATVITIVDRPGQNSDINTVILKCDV